MAARATVFRLGNFSFHDCLEAKPLNLSAEHFPFPCSLRDLVQDRYDDSPAPINSANTMELDELIGYLENVNDIELSPWMGILTQTEAMGDPALPSKEQSAILLWLGQALEQWEKQFPLEEALANQVKRLKPIAAALAITDDNFLQPGAHPIHQLLDAISDRAVGWQADLNRVAAILEQQVTKAVDKSCTWFQDKNLDITEVCEEFVAAAERDNARAQRMIQRVVETELGKVKTAAAKIEAARMINELLEKFSAPSEIGEFIRGPWYSSAQLVLLKFSQDSEQWEQMSSTTHTLLDSLQTMEEGDEDRKQYIFEVVTKLPKEMRRWLLSLHHDTEAVNEAMGLVEFAHLRILRNQALELETISPIVVAQDSDLNSSDLPSGASVDFSEGQWFYMDTPANGELRVQLVLKVEREEQLLFANMAGIKVMQMSFSEFSELHASGKVAALERGACFSRCLAQAAGIQSLAMLEALAKTQGAPENWRDANQPAPSEPPQKPELELVSSSENPAQSPEQPDKKQAAQASNAPEAVSPDSELASEATLDVNTSESDEKAFLEMLDDELLDDFGADVPLGGESEASPSDEPAPGPDMAETATPAEDAQFLAEPATNAEKAKDEESTPTTNTAPLAAEGEGFLLDQSQQLEDSSEPEPEPEPEIDDTATEANAAAAEPEGLDLPSGTWLGFHDGDTPLMARLAVHDPDEDQYIFVNRKGVKLRTATGAELRSLIEQGLVDIL
ncbi:MAG: DUF1631 family protein, partial [Halioglobus sp.]